MTDKVLSDKELYEKYISDNPKGKHRYVDLDEDGKQELFISWNNNEDELVTVIDGKIVRILHENRLFLCEGGIIGRKSEGSGGETLMYYRMEGQEAVLVDVVANPSIELAWYHSSEFMARQDMDRITKEEGQKICAQYPLLEDSMPGNLTRFYPE